MKQPSALTQSTSNQVQQLCINMCSRLLLADWLKITQPWLDKSSQCPRWEHIMIDVQVISLLPSLVNSCRSFRCSCAHIGWQLSNLIDPACFSISLSLIHCNNRQIRRCTLCDILYSLQLCGLIFNLSSDASWLFHTAWLGYCGNWRSVGIVSFLSVNLCCCWWTLYGG